MRVCSLAHRRHSSRAAASGLPPAALARPHPKRVMTAAVAPLMLALINCQRVRRHVP